MVLSGHLNHLNHLIIEIKHPHDIMGCISELLQSVRNDKYDEGSGYYSSDCFFPLNIVLSDNSNMPIDSNKHRNSQLCVILDKKKEFGTRKP